MNLVAGTDPILIRRTEATAKRAPEARVSRVIVRGLTKTYPVRRRSWEVLRHPFSSQRTTVLDALDLDVFDAEMFGILGLNGAGKTTLLKMLATLIVPDSGSAVIDGHDINDDTQPVRALLAMVTADERSLNWRLSATENMLLFAGLHRMDAKKSRAVIGETLTTVGLHDSGDKIVGTFSSGMRQRLLLARTLLSNPSILLLDEPTRSLDPVAAHEFRRLLRQLADAHRVTIVLATHNPDEAFTYCDRVAVLHRGKIAALGRASDLAAHFGRDRYRIWSNTREHPCFNALVRRGLIQEVSAVEDAEGRIAIECTIEGGEAQAAEVLRRLVESHVAVSRFERVALPLSTLIARIVESQLAPTRQSAHA